MKNQLELINRWGQVLQNVMEDIPCLYECYKDPKKNYKGGINAGLHDDYRLLATLHYLLNRDAVVFKDNLIKAVPFTIELFKKYDQGGSIAPSRVSMILFIELFDALASGDMDLAQDYAHHLGGRKEAEEEYDDEFVLSMGYSLKYAVENNLEAFKLWLPKLKAICEDPKNRVLEFRGYPLVLEALLERNVEKANAAFKVLIEGHKKKCQSGKGPDYGPYFHESPDEDLFVWGIGLGNLCRYYGLDVQIVDPLIPEELLNPVRNR